MELLHDDLTYEVIGSAMAVHSEIGPGWDEWDYHRAMVMALSQKGIPVATKVHGALLHLGAEVDRFQLDMIVDGKVILELKHLDGDFAGAHYGQIIGYLKFWGKDLGMLINFGLDRLTFARVPHSERSGSVKRAGRHAELPGGSESIVSAIEEGCGNILREHGLGYAPSTYLRMLAQECRRAGMIVQRPRGEPRFRGQILGQRDLNAVLVADDVLICATAFPRSTRAVDVARVRSYVRWRDARLGLLVNFGRDTIELRPVPWPAPPECVAQI